MTSRISPTLAEIRIAPDERLVAWWRTLTEKTAREWIRTEAHQRKLELPYMPEGPIGHEMPEGPIGFDPNK